MHLLSLLVRKEVLLFGRNASIYVFKVWSYCVFQEFFHVFSCTLLIMQLCTHSFIDMFVWLNGTLECPFCASIQQWCSFSLPLEATSFWGSCP